MYVSSMPLFQLQLFTLPPDKDPSQYKEATLLSFWPNHYPTPKVRFFPDPITIKSALSIKPSAIRRSYIDVLKSPAPSAPTVPARLHA